MTLFLHVCCAPCLLYPARVLADRQIPFTCFFFNPNIHPFKEFKKRLDTFVSLAESRQYPYVLERDYGLRSFLRAVVFQEQRRCTICYHTRLEKTCQRAAAHDFTAVSTTLLYSKYQRHEELKNQAERFAKQYHLTFYYHDFRSGWQHGIDESRSLGLYRQPYCGCIYSEQERYDNRLKKQIRKKEVSNV
ncbi:MAG: epoxyqueuosine reductase QueH [Desulfofustis sp.]|jgi:predicted adenine nucleotide alpha hydrolase (AANH) superfamily ATPase|nr:epoxyqueuosine reductase QueH [Desulfofustis sp.]